MIVLCFVGVLTQYNSTTTINAWYLPSRLSILDFDVFTSWSIMRISLENSPTLVMAARASTQTRRLTLDDASRTVHATGFMWLETFSTKKITLKFTRKDMHCARFWIRKTATSKASWICAVCCGRAQPWAWASERRKSRVKVKERTKCWVDCARR